MGVMIMTIIKAANMAVCKEIDWREFAKDVTRLLKDLKCKYYIKADFKKFFRAE